MRDLKIIKVLGPLKIQRFRYSRAFKIAKTLEFPCQDYKAPGFFGFHGFRGAKIIKVLESLWRQPSTAIYSTEIKTS